jgi:hypothetical protein
MRLQRDCENECGQQSAADKLHFKPTISEVEQW